MTADDVRPRSAWLPGGAAVPPPAAPARVRCVIVHHTALGAGSSPADVPALLREVHGLHVERNGWDDVGYNLLVDRFGGVWEGRAGSRDGAVAGAHALGHNATSAGIALLGDWREGPVPDAAVAALRRAIRWALGRHGLTPGPATVRGHGDVADTACPGAALLARMDELRAPA